MSRPTPPVAGISTRAAKRVTPEEDEGSQPAEDPPELRDPTERPLTASTFQRTMERFSETLLRQQMDLQAQQQRFMEQLTNQLISHRMEERQLESADNFQRDTPSSTPRASNGSRNQPNVKVSWLATQIPEFGGGADESANQWVRRVDKVAQVHGAADGAVLLAASSKLVKSAKKWYDIQTGTVVESWLDLKTELVKLFERKLPFYRVMQRAEARKWSASKETFDQYAIDKLSLLYQMNLPESDKIHLLISGINQTSIRTTALSLASESLDVFLEKMRCITEGASDFEKKFPLVSSTDKTKEVSCRNCGKKGHEAKHCKAEPICFYCKITGHRSYECPKLGSRATAQGSRAQGAQVTAPVTEVEATAAVLPEEAAENLDEQNPRSE